MTYDNNNSGSNFLTEEQQFYRRLSHGDAIWRPATVHAEAGLMAHDIDVREQPPMSLGNTIVLGYVAYAVSGDIENLGVLPLMYDVANWDKAHRFCTNWLENARKPGEYIGMRIFLPDLPPPGWTHVVVDQIDRVTVDPATNRGYYCYYGRWASEPARFAKRYHDAYVVDMKKSANGRRLSQNPKLMAKIAEMFSLDKVNKNLGIDRVFLTNTPANTDVLATDAATTTIPVVEPASNETPS
jgi:hypothetical protein